METNCDDQVPQRDNPEVPMDCFLLPVVAGTAAFTLLSFMPAIGTLPPWANSSNFLSVILVFVMLVFPIIAYIPWKIADESIRSRLWGEGICLEAWKNVVSNTAKNAFNEVLFSRNSSRPGRTLIVILPLLLIQLSYGFSSVQFLQLLLSTFLSMFIGTVVGYIYLVIKFKVLGLGGPY